MNTLSTFKCLTDTGTLGTEKKSKKYGGIVDINAALSLLRDMQKRVSSSLLYVSTLDNAVNSFDRISNSEIHILSKLNRFLTDASAEIAAKPELGVCYNLSTCSLICPDINFLHNF